MLYPQNPSSVGRSIRASTGQDIVDVQLGFAASQGSFQYQDPASGEVIDAGVKGFTPWGWTVAAHVDTKAVDELHSSLLVRGMLQTLMMAVIFVVLLMWASRIMVKQVNHLVDGINFVAKKDLSQSIELHTMNEFGDIARAVRAESI